MIPKNGDIKDIKIVREPTNTYKLNLNRNQIVKYTDGLEAMEQFIYKALLTNRYDYVIYDWNYGFEIDDLYGKPITIVKAKLPGRITEALIHDERIISIDNFYYSEPKDSVVSPRKTTVCIHFTVTTIFGKIDFSKVLEV